MAILPIRIFPDPILRKRARHIHRFDETIRALTLDMIDTMENAGGVGLAAPQVGVLKRVITLHMPESEPFAAINPEITSSEGKREVLEGCLSIPGYTGLINRALRIDVMALDAVGGRLQITADELLAQALEHEIDHLNGVMFLDHLEDHYRLEKTGTTPSEPHWHDVGYEVYAERPAKYTQDIRLVELLKTTARLSRITSESSLDEIRYDFEGGSSEVDAEEVVSVPEIKRPYDAE